MLESLLNKAAGLQLILKWSPTQVLTCLYCEIFKKIYFEEHLQTAASVELNKYMSLIYSETCLKRTCSKVDTWI